MRVQPKLPFDQVNETALGQYPDILFRWFPAGVLVDGRQEFAIGDLSGTPGHRDDGGSVKVNIRTGKWAEMNGKEPAGHDPISLYAWAFCGGDRVSACKELGASLGIAGCNPRPGAEVVPFVPRNPPRKAPEVDWRPMVPPPDGVRDPNAELRQWDHVFVYRDRDRNRLRYVVRNDAKGGQPKKIRPLTYGYLKDENHRDGETGWHLRGPASPKGLYGLEKLDGRPVLLQEGEKKTDDVQKLLPGHACLSLTFGTGGENHNDLTPLGGHTVICSPDNDAGGRDTMRGVAAQLRKLGATVTLLDHTGQTFEKWDLGNAVTGEMPDGTRKDPWTAKRLAEYLKARAVPNLDEPDGDVDADALEQEEEDDSEWLEKGEKDAKTRPPLPLGYDGDFYFYLSPVKKQIKALTASQHVKLEMMGLADLCGYWEKSVFMGKKAVDWEAAAADLMGSCAQVGVFNPERVRGRGAWPDNGRAVMNVGNRLIVDGEDHPLMLGGTSYIYAAAQPLKYTVADPLTKEQAGELAELCKLFSWDKPIYGTLMAGWLAVAPICGALNWRPAIWLTGGSGSGKSTLEKLIIQPALGGIGLFLKGGTTEAGVRQKLGRDARPLWFDEAESENPKAKGIMQGILDLNRQSSSEGGAEIIKGTQSQNGAKTYHVRSCFGFSSINPMLEHLADESRLTVLELTSHNAAARAGFDALVERIDQTMTDDFCAGFVARSVWLMPVILDNAKTFSKAVAVHLGNSRVGDQIGTLLAGAFSEISDNRVSPEAARKWVEEQDWSDTTSADADPDERRLVNFLFQQHVTVKVGGSPYDRTIGDLILAANGGDLETMGEKVASDVLLRHGIKFDAREGGVWIANKHATLTDFLKDTPWAAGHHRALRRITGAKDSGKAVWFGVGAVQRAVFVPVDLTE